MKNIAVLGSTGSIGTQTLEIAEERGDIRVWGLSAAENIDLLEKQIRRFKPKLVAVMNPEKAKLLKERIGSLAEVSSGIEGLIEVATLDEAEIIVTAVVGMVGLRPTAEAIKAGKNIALANKETLVTAGEIIMPLAGRYGVDILPVDSEHSALFQSLQGEDWKRIEKLHLTASGGPFRGWGKEELAKVKLEDALKHPNWTMGKKITIDSSTMMNKGLEVHEAKWLFDVKPEQISVLVHPQSIVHSMVEFVDGSNIAQLGLPDMKLPIQYAIYYPDRVKNSFNRLDLAKIGQLTFEAPDLDVFTCLKLAYNALDEGGTMPTVMNAANEWAVARFIGGGLGYKEIPVLIETLMSLHKKEKLTSIEQIVDTERWALETAERLYGK